MAELSLEAKDEIRNYLESREKRLAIFGATGLLALLGLVGGFLAYVMNDVRTRGELAAELAARNTIESLKLTVFDPKVRQIDEQIRLAQERFNTEALRLTAVAASIDQSKKVIEELSDKSKQALEDLNKAQGSLLFADTILEIREEILAIKALQTGTQPSSNTTPLSKLLEQEKKP